MNFTNHTFKNRTIFIEHYSIIIKFICIFIYIYISLALYTIHPFYVYRIYRVVTHQNGNSRLRGYEKKTLDKKQKQQIRLKKKMFII